MPLLAPVLTVVFVTQIIGVLKLFDLILAVAPGSTQNDATTLAFVMWQVVLQRPEPLRARRRDRHLHPRSVHPLPDRQHPALPSGDEPVATVDPPSRPTAIPTRAVGQGHPLPRPGADPPRAALIGIFWLVPTTGLFITSLLPPAGPARRALVELRHEAERATLENYRNIFDNTGFTHAIWVTVQVTIGATILPIIIAALAAYALAWIDFPGRDWLFLAVVGLLLVPLQMALIPIFRLYNELNLFDTVLG